METLFYAVLFFVVSFLALVSARANFSSGRVFDHFGRAVRREDGTLIFNTLVALKLVVGGFSFCIGILFTLLFVDPDTANSLFKKLFFL